MNTFLVLLTMVSGATSVFVTFRLCRAEPSVKYDQPTGGSVVYASLAHEERHVKTDDELVGAQP
jgi:hypothetical protein